MRRKRKFRYQKRTFLNTDENLRAYVIAHVRESEGDDRYTDTELEIADCSRQINLDFDFGANPASIRKAEKKIKLFRQIINDFADAIEAEIEFMKAQPKLKKSRKKRSVAEQIGIREIEIDLMDEE